MKGVRHFYRIILSKFEGFMAYHASKLMVSEASINTNIEKHGSIDIIDRKCTSNHSSFLVSIFSSYHKCSSFATLILQFLAFLLKMPWLIAFEAVIGFSLSSG